jgi:hypothetical protein
MRTVGGTASRAEVIAEIAAAFARVFGRAIMEKE